MRRSTQNLNSPLIFDTSAIFNFGHRGEMQFLLKELKVEFELIVSPSVEKQTQEKNEYKKLYQEIISNYFEVRSVNFIPSIQSKIKSLVKKLGEADTDIIALGLETKGTVVIDDKEARKASEASGINYTGTIGIIEYSIKKNWITQSNAFDIIKRLIERGSRIPRLGNANTFEEYIDSIGE